MVDKIDAPPKKYVFSKRTYEDTIDELCFADLSDMSEFSEEQKKWIPSTHEMKVYTLPSLGRQKAVEDFFIALKQNLKRTAKHTIKRFEIQIWSIFSLAENKF